ncbi:hypothetical protein CH92_04455 [Stutzerimonas stutzeri]|uniref:ChrR-like cupin domain-containing protein n=2 Tax=Stutzerimonas stutzeri TaxID=316 RepID=W8RZP6_STUST|nr:hypothetical protein CH92_04455 [Stutzerimonas stutzeri]
MSTERAASSALQGRKTIAAKDAHWQPMHVADIKLDGVTMHLLVEADDRWRSYWMKMEAGSRSIMHRHSATEMLIVVEGSVTDCDGAVFRAADVVVYSVGSTHVLSSPRGCTLLVVESCASTLA